jgi:nitrite reductase/ring-hydroxylating ferredoxin subunit
MATFKEVAMASQVDENGGLCVEVAGKRIALFKIGGRIYAMDDACTHAGGSLSEGSIQGREVECPLHGARFDLQTGQATAPPASEDVATYPVRLRGDAIEVEL